CGLRRHPKGGNGGDSGGGSSVQVRRLKPLHIPMHVRRAQDGDAPEIARIIRTVWSDSNPDHHTVARRLDEDGRAAFITVHEGAAAGFVDAFRSAYDALDGTQPHFWEVDLLAVEPAFHGRGIGRALIEAARDAGRGAGTRYARALVRLDNVAAQTAFKRAGFALQP